MMFRGPGRDRTRIDAPWQMRSCLPQASASSAFRICHRSQVTLRLKALQRNNSTLLNSGPELVDVPWKRLGVPASVAATLRSVFPHIVKPTKTQARLIPAILSGKDVLLKDHTGTGKCVNPIFRPPSNAFLTDRPSYRSFGLILALLSDFRVWRSEHESHKKPTNASVAQRPRASICTVDPGHYRVQDPGPTSRTLLRSPGIGQDTRGTPGGPVGGTGTCNTPHSDRNATSSFE